MTETPVNRLVLVLGLPTTISMLVTNIYNMADTYFVSDLGNSASGAIGVVFALMAVIQAFGFMCGHGAGANISRRLGSHEIEEARMFASTGFYLSIFAGLAITVLGLTFQAPFMRLLGSTESILPYAMDYSRYVLLAAPFMAASCVLNNILRYEGKATFAMIGLVSGGVINIFGDWLLVGVLEMGVSGAGIATAVSQLIGSVILIIPFLTERVSSRLSPKYFTRSLKRIKNIVLVGLPSMMRQGLNSISVMVLNQAAAPYGDEAIAAMSIVARVIGFMFCVGLGLGQGFQPVCSFNYGARLYKRVRASFKFTFIFSTCLLGFIGLFGIIFAPQIIALFRDDLDVVRIGALALRVQSVSLLFMPMTVLGNMLFQCVGKSGRATFLASTRSGLFFIPTILILSAVFGLLGVQISQSISDLLSYMLAFPLAFGFLKNLPADGEDAE